MTFESFLQNILKDLRVELTDEFDRNFERKAFFDQAWPSTKYSPTRGSLLMRSGDLRGSIKSQVQGDSIHFTSSLPYATAHNEGATLAVTANMKKYFWAMYYRASGAVTKTKGGKASTSQRNVRLTAEAAFFKSLALMKLGSKINIPQRQFIGHHPQVDAAVKQVVDENVKDLDAYLRQRLNPKPQTPNSKL